MQVFFRTALRPIEEPASTPAAERVADNAKLLGVSDGFDEATVHGLNSQVGAARHAVETQTHLSEARVALGHAQLGGMDTTPQAARVHELERLESSQGQADVEKARLVVFLARFRRLEKAVGTTEAARIARNVYYSGELFEAVSGTKSLSPAEINATGLPHNPNPYEKLANHAFGSSMRMADGRLFDMGHVFCVLDWGLNAEDRPKFAKIPGAPVALPNVVTFKTMALTGDLGPSVTDYVQTRDSQSALDALAVHSANSNLRGGLYGLYLLKQLGTASMADALDRFFAQPPPAKELFEQIAHDYPRWFVSHDDGDASQVGIKRRGLWLSTYLQAVVQSGGRSAFSAVTQTHPVLSAFAEWMNREARNENPMGNS